MRLAVLAIALGLVACSTRPLGDGGDDGDPNGTVGTMSASDTDDSGPVNPPPPMVTTTGSADTVGGDEESSSDDGQTFLGNPDATTPGLECDLHAQDCARGYKCVPISIESTWDATTCVPVVEEPQGVGDPCVLTDPGTGVDDCGWGQYCWQVDRDGNGTCIGLCLLDDPADEFDYSCEDAEAEPIIGCQSCFCVCMNPCHPLEQDCPEGQGCYAVSDRWECAPDASKGMGAQNDGCEFLNGCEPGLLCLNADAVAGCEETGCCTAVCDIEEEPDPCPDQDLGMSCATWYEKGSAPPGYESVGVCAAL